jgi:hypothetical protein
MKYRQLCGPNLCIIHTGCSCFFVLGLDLILMGIMCIVCVLGLRVVV